MKSSQSDRKVNNLLNTLRGEHFRHAQNVSGSKIRIFNASHYYQPSLPLSQIFGGPGSETPEPDTVPLQPAPFRAPGQAAQGARVRPPVTLTEGVPTYAYPDGAVPGPKPPKSWSALFDREERNTPEWRRAALSIHFSNLPVPSGEAGQDRRVPSLTHVCLQNLLALCTSPEDLAECARYISPHLRRVLMRWCAVNRPLPDGKLYALCADDKHADGELVVVGPEASLRPGYIRGLRGHEGARASSSRLLEEDAHWGSDDRTKDNAEEDWDQSMADVPPPLTSLAILKVDLLSPSLLPPTLTHLSLLALPRAVNIHHLPGICPLIEVLDLSFNPWLTDPDLGTKGVVEGTLDRVEWKKWRQLRVLGLRECGVKDLDMTKVNWERWVDVEVIGI
ncbi:hypothetical protein BDW22DRAFT_1002644 [Trametopsis cervina]|nr:hypothetical protein BDW22DRAFT_1002644 [Trametopsis cervina]